MNKALLAFTLIVATAFATLEDLDLSALDDIDDFPIESGNVIIGEYGYSVAASTTADELGLSVSNVGDFNGDGFPDYIIGTATGTAFIILGRDGDRTAALDLADDESTEFFSIDAGSVVELIVGAAGDINNDGLDDVVIGIPEYVPNAGTANGGAVVIYGTDDAQADTFPTFDISTWTVTTAGFAIDAGDNTLLGASVSAAGDLDGDGIDDCLIGAANAVYVITGMASTGNGARAADVDLTDTTDPFYLITGVTGDELGSYVAALGDINGDGEDDVILGAPGNDRAYIVYGRATTDTPVFGDITLDTTGSAGLWHVIEGPAATEFGSNVGLAGDLNGDEAPDMFVGAYDTDVVVGSTTRTSAGAVYIIWGRDDGTDIGNIDAQSEDLLGEDGIIILGAAGSDYLGWQSDGIGDVNDDGFDDIGITAPGLNPANNAKLGKVYVIYGSTTITHMDLSDLTSAEGIVITGPVTGAGFGYSITTAGGDLNGDEIDDFIVTAPYATPSPIEQGDTEGTDRVEAGLAFEFYGEAVTAETPASSFRLEASVFMLISFFVALMF